MSFARTLATLLALAALLTQAIPALGKARMINVIGIDTQDPLQSYSAFYPDGEAFPGSCAATGIAPGPDCQLRLLQAPPRYATTPFIYGVDAKRD